MLQNVLKFPKLFLHILILIIFFFSSEFFAKTLTPLQRMQEKYKTKQTLTADFTQIQKNKLLGTAYKSSGKIFIKRPRFFLWETLDPEKSKLISDGKTVWYYTPSMHAGEKAQVLIQKNMDSQSQVAFVILSGQQDLQKTFSIQQKEPFSYMLKPLKLQGDIAAVELFIEKSTFLIYKVVLHMKTGKQTELLLTNIELGTPLLDSFFEFKIPPNTEVLH